MRLTRTKRALPLARMLRDVRSIVSHELPIRAVVVGDGPQRGRFEQYVLRHGMADWVSCPGRVSRAAVRETLARADCFIAPAELESFGIAALEARSAGLPVVASRHSGVSEFVRHGQEGLLADDDHAMTRAIARMVVDIPLRNTIRAHNEAVAPEHDWTAASLRTEALYSVAGARSCRHRRRAGARPEPADVAAHGR
jgi:glycosyltransferase involved in cell wall biosynthesis